MLFTILIWVYVFLLAFVYGFGLIQLVPVQDLPQAAGKRSLSIVVLIGLAALTSIAGALSLALNMGLAANLLILLGGVAAAFWQRKRLGQFLVEKIHALKHKHWLSILVFVTIFLVILLKSAQPAQNYDTGLYHGQTMRWMETYPAVPGLGNLSDRLVFNSNWLLLSALFSFSFAGPHSFHTLNAFLAILLCGFALSKFDRLLKGDVTLSSTAAVFLPFFLRRIFSLELSSPGTDLPTALMIWFVLTLSVEKVEERAAARFDFLFLSIFVLSLFAVTIKLSTLPILILPLYFFLRQGSRLRRSSFAVYAVLVPLLLLPWMGRGLIQSGYLIYPLPASGVFHPDWQIPEENVRGTVQWIRSWAKIATPDREAVEQMSIRQWAPVWFNALVPLDRQILALNGAALALLAFLLAYRSWHDGLSRALLSPYAIIYLTTLSGLLYWFFQAPAVRFGYSFLAFFPVICLAPFLMRILQSRALVRRWAVQFLLIALLAYQGVSIYRLANLETLRPVVAFPADYPRVPVQAHRVGGLTIYTPLEGDQCWYEPFPCVPAIDTNLRPRGSTLVDGFRMQP